MTRWFAGAKRVAESGCERSERRILAGARSVSARTNYWIVSGYLHNGGGFSVPLCDNSLSGLYMFAGALTDHTVMCFCETVHVV